MKRFTLALGLALAACGPAEPPPPTGDVFLAFPKDFNGYIHWESHALSSLPDQGAVHTTGDRTVYLNRRPEHGSTAFPVGTIVVKVLPGMNKVFGMVKRGGGYNPGGAEGWEWFELQHLNAEDVTIVWRGVGPPSGEGYGGDPTGCNTCHKNAQFNDYVQTSTLRLQDF